MSKSGLLMDLMNSLRIFFHSSSYFWIINTQLRPCWNKKRINFQFGLNKQTVSKYCFSSYIIGSKPVQMSKPQFIRLFQLYIPKQLTHSTARLVFPFGFLVPFKGILINAMFALKIAMAIMAIQTFLAKTLRTRVHQGARSRRESRCPNGLQLCSWALRRILKIPLCRKRDQTLKTIFKKFRGSKKDPFPVWA